MARDGEPARRRLMEAALALFAENGFDGTTAVQIAARAGLTERTFFRHFTDKREVLFDGQAVLADAFTAAILGAPLSMEPIAMIRCAFESMIDVMQENRTVSEPRQKIIAATPALREREIAKRDALTQTLASALQQKGVAPRRADLAARTGLTVLSYALDAWFACPGSRLADHLDDAFAELRHITS